MSIKTPKQGTRKNPGLVSDISCNVKSVGDLPAYWAKELYHPALIASTLNLFSANSVAFELKTLAVLVWNIEKARIAQNIHGNWNILRSSNFLFFSVRVS